MVQLHRYACVAGKDVAQWAQQNEGAWQRVLSVLKLRDLSGSFVTADNVQALHEYAKRNLKDLTVTFRENNEEAWARVEDVLSVKGERDGGYVRAGARVVN